ncbi:helix-turn-helix transcriptional regulator [Candidatus Pacearchaeota archaeon]|nr:helix-turn-helix transcriptional regulator [Candidatus Pacearchaeota archaeon]
MNNKYIMLDLDDQRIANLADVISNKTSKKIIEHLADKEASETEIATALKLPANTVNYNIKKLLEAGLIEKTKTYFWSVKGKKIHYYKVANKKIIISPKPIKTIVPVIAAFVITGIAALGIKIYTSNILKSSSASVEKSLVMQEYADVGQIAAASSDTATAKVAEIASQLTYLSELWLWFLFGGITALIIYLIIKKIVAR